MGRLLELSKNVVRILFATPQRKDDRLQMRAWFVFYLAYMIAVCFISNWGFLNSANLDRPWAKSVWFLGLFVFYFSLACSYIPLPTAWLVLLLASPSGGLTFLPPFWRVLAVAGLGALATGVSHTNEYHVLVYLLRLGKIHLIKETRIYRWAEKQFKTWPFGLQFLFNVLPVPADPSRWLAALSGYPLPKFFCAQALGRFVRYGALAFVAESLKLTLVQVIIISAALVVLSFAAVTIQKLRQKKEAEPPIDITTA
jgi:membrane protein YqaA with SNARE-associated domain